MASLPLMVNKDYSDDKFLFRNKADFQKFLKNNACVNKKNVGRNTDGTLNYITLRDVVCGDDNSETLREFSVEDLYFTEPNEKLPLSWIPPA
jgi:hypothetical protein